MRNVLPNSIPALVLFLLLQCQAPIWAQKAPEQLVVSGTILLKDKAAPDYKAIISAIKTNWKLKADSVNIADKTLIFNTIGGATVMLAFLDYPVAADEIGAAARLSWIWKTAAAETMNHQAQVVISVIGAGNRSLDLHKIFTQTAAATLEVTRAPAIYMDGQYLLLSNGYYTAAARNMVQNQSLPLYCWVYFGRPGNGGGFTYGLTEFGLSEFEIVGATQAEGDVHSTLYDAALTVVKYATVLKDGQNLTTEEGTKAVVRLTNGTFLEDKKVLRLEF